MDDQNISVTSPPKREPWNKGKLTGAKPPLRPKAIGALLLRHGSIQVKA